MKKLIVGVDLGYTGVGLAMAYPNKTHFRIIDCHTIIKKLPAQSDELYVSDRNVAIIMETTREFSRIIAELRRKHEVFCVVELPSGGSKGAIAARAMALSVGWFAAAVALLDIKFTTCTPRQAKIALTGFDDATKDFMMESAREQHSYYKDFPNTKYFFEHISDAIGALAHAFNGDLLLEKFLKVNYGKL